MLHHSTTESFSLLGVLDLFLLAMDSMERSDSSKSEKQIYNVADVVDGC